MLLVRDGHVQHRHDCAWCAGFLERQPLARIPRSIHPSGRHIKHNTNTSPAPLALKHPLASDHWPAGRLPRPDRSTQHDHGRAAIPKPQTRLTPPVPAPRRAYPLPFLFLDGNRGPHPARHLRGLPLYRGLIRHGVHSPPECYRFSLA